MNEPRTKLRVARVVAGGAEYAVELTHVTDIRRAGEDAATPVHPLTDLMDRPAAAEAEDPHSVRGLGLGELTVVSDERMS